MSRLLLSMKPAAAAAHPEYELSIDTTTGMSPPPIAATRCQPSASETTVMIASGTRDGLAMNQHQARGHHEAPRFSQFRPGSVSGADFIFAESLRYATIEPVNVTAPMSTPRKTSTRCTASACVSVR